MFRSSSFSRGLSELAQAGESLGETQRFEAATIRTAHSSIPQKPPVAMRSEKFPFLKSTRTETGRGFEFNWMRGKAEEVENNWHNLKADIEDAKHSMEPTAYGRLQTDLKLLQRRYDKTTKISSLQTNHIHRINNLYEQIHNKNNTGRASPITALDKVQEKGSVALKTSINTEIKTLTEIQKAIDDFRTKHLAEAPAPARSTGEQAASTSNLNTQPQ